MKRILTTLAFAASMAACPAHAQDAGAPVAPAQIAAAKPVVEKLFPVGTYRKLMGGTMTRLMDSMIGPALDMPVADIARMSGVAQDKVAAMDKATMGQVMAILDPHFRDRMRVGMNAMMGAMAEVMTGYEPRIRDALTRAYARRFSASQLGELNAFFATPTGGTYAAESMSLFMDPEIMAEMQAVMPDMIKQMPKLVGVMGEATKDMPKARRIADLSKKERAELARLMGVEERALKGQ